MALILLIVLLAIVLGIIGVVIKGLFYLLIIGVVVFLLDMAYLGTRKRTRRRSPR